MNESAPGLRLPGEVLAHTAFFVAAVAISVGGWMLHQAQATVFRTSVMVDRSVGILRTLSSFDGATSRAEAAHRGFLISARNDDAAERDAAIQIATGELGALSREITGESLQHGWLGELQGAFQERVERMREEHRARMDEGVPAAVKSLDASHALYTRLNESINALKGANRATLSGLRDKEQRDDEIALGTLIIAVAISLLLVAAAYVAFLVQGRARRRVETRFADLVELLPGAVFQYRSRPDGSGTYEFLSGKTEAIAGVNRDAALQDSRTVLAGMNDAEREELVARLGAGQILDIDYQVPGPDGTRRWVHASSAPRAEPDGTILWSGYWTDVTRKRAVHQALKDAKEAADAASRAKTTFLATMSHEIRTPMNGVLGMMELLSLTKLDAEQRSSVSVVQESGRSLLRIIDDILDFSKVEAGKLDLAREPTSIAALVGRVANVHVGNASAKGLLLTHTCGEGLSPLVMADPIRLQQILNNLLANAIKFTAVGHVSLHADVHETRPGVEVVRFTVSDTGIGMSAADCSRAFQPFMQARDTAGYYGGTGLGLSICHRLAVLMGGDIALHSDPGVGTRVTVTVPFTVADSTRLRWDEKESAAAGSLKAAHSHAGRILVVDDQPVNRLVLQKQVMALGFSADAASDGADALQKWNGGDYQLILTDLNMPRLDGFALAREIRAAEKAAGRTRVPILASTANAMSGVAVSCYAAGIDDCLVKPVEIATLAAKLGYWLGGDGTRSIVDPGIFLESEARATFHRANEESAVALERGLNRNDLDAISAAARRMARGARSVGARALACVADELDSAGHRGDWSRVAEARISLGREQGRLTAHLDLMQRPAT